MKKGISIWSFREPSLVKCFQMAKAAGFDGVEVALDETGEVSLESTQQELEAVLAAARREGIALYSVASGLGWAYPLTDNDTSVRAKAETIIKKQIDTAAILQCDTILVVPGVVSEEVSYEAAYERALDAIKRIAPYAEATLMSCFKAEYHITIIAYLHQVRLHHAEQMLVYSQKSVKEISTECGFSGQNYFTRLFTKRYGMSPVQYRKNYTDLDHNEKAN